ncbi:MAG: VOC family protein [Cyclobacteriaceae bacterium]
MKFRIISLLIISTLYCLLESEAQVLQSVSLNLRTYGVKINVTDMDKAIDFYSRQLGFEIESRKNYPNLVELKSNDENKLILNLVRNLVAEGPKDIKAGLTLQVNDYDKSVAKLKERGVDFGNNVKRKEGVGYSIYFTDPFGTQLSTMHVTVIKEEPFIEPRIYNYGVLVPDMGKAREFFKKLGFVERSERYLPLDMPLGHPDKSFGFMIHFRDGIEALHYNTANDEHVVILFKTDNLDFAFETLKKSGIETVQSKIQESELGRYISFRDSFGMVYELVEVN